MQRTTYMVITNKKSTTDTQKPKEEEPKHIKKLKPITGTKKKKWIENPQKKKQNSGK